VIKMCKNSFETLEKEEKKRIFDNIKQLLEKE